MRMRELDWQWAMMICLNVAMGFQLGMPLRLN